MFPLADVIPARTRPAVTVLLIVASTLVFAWLQWLPTGQREQWLLGYGLQPGSGIQAILPSLLLHDDWSHWGGNMLYLWLFGSTLEDRLGHGRFLALLLICGSVAGLVQLHSNIWSAPWVVGAAGAIGGVLAAYLVLFPGSRVLIAVPLVNRFELVEAPVHAFAGAWVVLQIATRTGVLGPVHSPGFAGQLAGATAGALLVWLLRRPERMQMDWVEHGSGWAGERRRG